MSDPHPAWLKLMEEHFESEEFKRLCRWIRHSQMAADRQHVEFEREFQVKPSRYSLEAEREYGTYWGRP